MRIRQAREEMGLNAGTFADAISSSRPVLYRRESGQPVPLDELVRIAKFTDRPIAWFVQDAINGDSQVAREIRASTEGVEITPALLNMIERWSRLTSEQRTLIGMVMREILGERPPGQNQ